MTDVPQATTSTTWLTRNPLAIMYVIQTGIALGMGFGLDVSTIQMGLILAFTGAIMTVITQQQVTPFVPVGTTPNAPVANTPNLTPIKAEAEPANAEADIVVDKT